MSRSMGETRRAALLLEVVIALTILTTAMGFLCAQLSRGLDMTDYSERQLHAAYLSERVLAQLEQDPNFIEQLDELPEAEPLEAEFGEAYPGYFWRVWWQPISEEDETLRQWQIEVLHQANPELIDDSDTARVVYHVAFLKAPRATVNLIEDGGLSEGMAEQLRATLPIPDFDPQAVDLHEIVAINPELLLELLPTLMSLMGDLSSLQEGGIDALRDQFSGALSDELPDLGAGGLTPEQREQVRELIEGQIGGAAPPGGRGPRHGRGMGGSGGGGEGEKPEAPAGGGRRGAGRGAGAGAGSGPGGGGRSIEELMRMREELARQRGR